MVNSFTGDTMRSLGVLAVLAALTACGGSVTAPSVGPTDTTYTPRRVNTAVRPYKVSAGQLGASASLVSASVVKPMSEFDIVQENWGPDSIVYSVNSSGVVSLNLFAQARNLSSPDSAPVPNTVVHWRVVKTAYSDDPKLADSAFGLDSAVTTTDAAGNTINKFTFDADTAVFNTYGGYFYIDISTVDSSGNTIKQGRFYLLQSQPPTWIAYWDGKFASFDTLNVSVPADTGYITFDVGQHVTFLLVKGADTQLGYLAIDHVEAFGCTAKGTVLTCPVFQGQTVVNVYPDITNNLPAGVTTDMFDPNAHTFFGLAVQ